MIAPGTYIATATGASIYESTGGALMIAFAFEIPVEQGEPERLTAHQCIVQKDGTVSTITIGMMKSCWGWDGNDPFWLTESENLAGKEVEVVVVEETYTGKDGVDKTGLKVKYINPPGGAARLPENADRKSVLAKYGAKFRAVAGGVPVKKPAAKAPPPPAAKKLAPPVTKPKHPPSTLEAAWEALCHTLDGKTEEEIVSAWTKIVASEVPGKENQSDFTPEEWGAVKAAAEDNVPY